MHILIVEAEPALRQIAAACLTGAGHRVEQAATVAVARALLARGDFDVALCDVRLPDGDGTPLLRDARQSGRDTIFVFVAAFGSVEPALEALRAGAFDYVTRPLSRAELLHRIGQIVAMRGLREENRALREAVRENSQRVFRLPSSGMPEVGRLAGATLRAQMRCHESDIIVRALEQADGDRRVAAQRLGIGLSSLYRKLEELDIRDRVRAA